MTETGMGRSDAPPESAGAGLGEHLVGAPLPPLILESTAGRVALDQLAAGLLVLFVYPHATGLPDAPVPGWELIPGARGCTAQSCAFRDEHEALTSLGAKLAGLSVQTVDEQREFRARVGLRYPLISDPQRQLEAALGLPTFTAAGITFYKRLTFIAAEGRIVKVFYPIPAPERNATDVREWLEHEQGDAHLREPLRSALEVNPPTGRGHSKRNAIAGADRLGEGGSE
jgi:peroxiredoxin